MDKIFLIFVKIVFIFKIVLFFCQMLLNDKDKTVETNEPSEIIVGLILQLAP
jgi:hypothetical protein